jgi:3-phosphoshikimate 1-carboxyvinyltransferase
MQNSRWSQHFLLPSSSAIRSLVWPRIHSKIGETFMYNPSYIIAPSQLKGSLTIPPSKSQTLRAILFAALATGSSHIQHPLHSPDVEAMIMGCRALGAHIYPEANGLTIEGCCQTLMGAEDIIHAGNSGIVLRFLSAIAAQGNQHIVITGDHSIRHRRPMQPLLSALAQLGVNALSTRQNGYAPLIIQGPLKPGKALLSGEDSQHISSLLIAASFTKGPTEIVVHNPGEKPWVELTLSWLERLGIPYRNHLFSHYYLPGDAQWKGFHYSVPGDLSSALFPTIAAWVTKSKLTLYNADMEDNQGDKKFFYVLQQMGAQIEIDATTKAICIDGSSSRPLKGETIDINDFIDALAGLAVIGCFAEGITHIKNAAIARTKECDRIHCLATELTKMGANIQELDDGLLIKPSPLHGASLNSHQDHRLAMALTVAALGASSPSTLHGADCVAKTYPHFFEQLQQLGAHIKPCLN